MIVALDISLKSTGYALAERGGIAGSGVIALPEMKTGTSLAQETRRLIEVRNKVMDLVDTAKPRFVIMEDLPFSVNQSYAKAVAGVSHMIRAELYTDHIPYAVANVASLKKFAVGQGGSKKNPVHKEHILKAVFQRWGHDVSSNDQADAIVLAYLGMALAGEWEPTTDAQRAVMATVRAAHKGIDFSDIGISAPGLVSATAPEGEGWVL